MDNSTMQAIEDDLYSVELPLSIESPHALNHGQWHTSLDASVDPSWSSHLSYISDSEAACYPLPEMDAHILSAGQWIHYPTEHAYQGPLMCASPHVSSQSQADQGYPQFHGQERTSIACASPLLSLYSGNSPTDFVQAGPIPYARVSMPLPNGPSVRPILPRTEAASVSGQPTFGNRRELRPQIPGSRNRSAAEVNVSSTAGHPRDEPKETPRPTVSSAQATFESSQHRTLMMSVTDPTTDDFKNFIHVDQYDHSTPEILPIQDYSQEAVQMRISMPGFDVQLPELSMLPATVKSGLSDQEYESFKSTGSESDKAFAATYQSSNASDSDEGRHRTDPSYNAIPCQDGLYHCPYKANNNCEHKPTKLKCNYDKYIDSHLKPFRCKVKACEEQKFSSTACLLRHEREAHGMHGHGDRPHLCTYEPCERSQPGNGFPRRYNLFDHMKRVHDHKDDASGSPILGGETQKKTKVAKRRASSPLTSAPPAQRPKADPQRAPRALVSSVSCSGYGPSSGYYH